MTKINQLWQEIIAKTIEYYEAKFAQKEFIPGKTHLSYADVSLTNKDTSPLLHEDIYLNGIAPKQKRDWNGNHDGHSKPACNPSWNGQRSTTGREYH
jgi:hypothetical protein